MCAGAVEYLNAANRMAFRRPLKMRLNVLRGRLTFLTVSVVMMSMVALACASDPAAPTDPSPAQAGGLSPTPSVPSSFPNMKIRRVFPTFSLGRMVYLTHPKGVTDRLYLVLKPGRIMVFDNTPRPSRPDTFLDIRDRVSEGSLEEGLLGLAFDPQYQENGYFYVYYSAASPRRSVVARYEASLDGAPVDPSTERIVMEIEQPFSNHNGGHLVFGPDGYLYIGVGDGGNFGDPNGHGQNLGTLLGSILRIDVSAMNATGSYSVPDDNPFVDERGARPEIWAYGLRNPWRFSFDRESGELWVGDVGQDEFEEIDLVTRGGNYGWNVMEASSCFQAASCDKGGLEEPIAEYGREAGISVTGGYVYRGRAAPSLVGAYLFGDFHSGRIWALRRDDGQDAEVRELVNTDLKISSFAEGPDGEIYILSFSGIIARLDPE